MPGLRERKVPGLSLRVGVAVGDVTEEDGDVFGPAVVTASRLCSAAGEHQILATDMVRMLAGDRGGHHYEAVGELILKGIADPVPACTIRVDAAPDAGGRLPAALAATPAELVVGRGAELDVLSVAFKAASAGERRAVLVAGEPGVGKTRLVAALARRAHDEGALVLFGRCEEDLAVAYQPFAEALRAGWPALDPEVVAAHVAEHGGEIRRLVPAIEAAEPVRAEPALEQARLFDAVTDLLHRAAEDRPVVLVLDDLHWAAPSTIALLRHLLSAGPDHSLCVLGTYRDTEVDRSHALGGLLADIHRTAASNAWRCAASTATASRTCWRPRRAMSSTTTLRALAAALAERTDGNPFFANQVLRHLVERGVLVQDGGRWTVSGSLDDVDLPEGVLDVVGRRLSRLSPAANQALAVAALGGLEFGVRVLCEVPDAGTPDAVVDGLDEAVRARLLVETGPGRFAFIHAIVRDALTRELTIAKRARLHRALGEAILAVYGDAPDAPPRRAGPPLHRGRRARRHRRRGPMGDRRRPRRSRPGRSPRRHRRAGTGAGRHRGRRTRRPGRPVRCRRRARRAPLRPRWNRPASTGVGGRRRSPTAIRCAHAPHRHGRACDPAGIELYEEALQLLDPEAAPLRALAIASLAWLRSLQAIPGFIDDVETANGLLADIDASAPKVAAAVRWRSRSPPWGFPAPRTGSACATRPWPSPPTPRTRGGTSSPPASTSPVELHLCRGHSLMALGRRAEFETNLAQLMELGETTGNSGFLAVAHAGVALLALLDGRFHDVPTSADRMLEAAPDGELRSRTSRCWSVAIEEGRSPTCCRWMEARPGHSRPPCDPRQRWDGSASRPVIRRARPRPSTTSSAAGRLGPRLELAHHARRDRRDRRRAGGHRARRADRRRARALRRRARRRRTGISAWEPSTATGACCSACSAATTKPSPRSPPPSPWRSPSSRRPSPPEPATGSPGPAATRRPGDREQAPMSSTAPSRPPSGSACRPWSSPVGTSPALTPELPSRERGHRRDASGPSPRSRLEASSDDANVLRFLALATRAYVELDEVGPHRGTCTRRLGCLSNGRRRLRPSREMNP